MLRLLTPEPFRGDQIAAGAVALTVLVGLLSLRLQDDLGAGGRLAITVVVLALLTTIAWRSPTEPTSPRGYQVALYLCTWFLTLVALRDVVELLDAELAQATTLLWTSAVLMAVAVVWARARYSAALTLLAALSGIVLVLSAAETVGDPSPAGYRRLLLVCAVVLALVALARRDRRPAHAAQLANAAGIAVGAILASAALEGVGFLLRLAGGPAGGVEVGLGTGWELLGLAAGFGLVAYGAVDEHRGPVVVGIVVLAEWLLVVGADGGLVGWPLVLAVGALFLLVVGLRPATPLPPPPGEPDLPDTPLPLPWRRDRS